METIKKQVKLEKINKTKFDEVYGLDYFYSKYQKKYPPNYFGKKGIRDKKIDKSLYKQILIEYMDIYFKEIYFLEGNKYFLYTGSLEKVLYRPRVIKNKIKKIVSSSIGFLWFQRPSGLFFELIRFIKLTGSTNRLPKIENIYKNNFDINLIVNFEDRFKTHLNNKTLFLNK